MRASAKGTPPQGLMLKEDHYAENVYGLWTP